MAITDPERLHRAPVDAFTPLVALGGMVSRAAGVDATQALYLSLVAEALANSTVGQRVSLFGEGQQRPETPINAFVDIAAGMAGWFLMDWAIRRTR